MCEKKAKQSKRDENVRNSSVGSEFFRLLKDVLGVVVFFYISLANQFQESATICCMAFVLCLIGLIDLHANRVLARHTHCMRIRDKTQN